MPMLKMTRDRPTIHEIFCPTIQDFTGTRKMIGETHHYCFACGTVVEEDPNHQIFDQD